MLSDILKPNGRFKRGDLFEIILIQIKGGGAKYPSRRDLRRLQAVAYRYDAKAVVLAVWKKGTEPSFFVLRRRKDGQPDLRDPWQPTDPGLLFR